MRKLTINPQYKCLACGCQYNSLAKVLRCPKCQSKRFAINNSKPIPEEVKEIMGLKVPFLRLMSAMNLLNKQFEVFDNLERLGDALRKQNEAELGQDIKEITAIVYDYAINAKMDLLAVEDFFNNCIGDRRD